LGGVVPTYRISILPGDGTGVEVIREAQRVLDTVADHSSLDFDFTEIPCGGKHYLSTGEEWPEGSYEICRDESDAILLGAIGWPGARTPNGDLAGGQVILGLRAGLDLYANVRPVRLYDGVQHKVHGSFQQVWDPHCVDMLLLRENTEGLYHSLLRRSADKAIGKDPWEPKNMDFPGLDGEVAWDPRPISASGSRRVIDMAFKLSDNRNGCPEDGTKRVTCVDKSNVTRGCQLFRKTYIEVSKKYPHIATDEAYIDAFTMWVVRQPEWFDVAVMPNMFGDIATDLASVLQGGMGMAPSGNIGLEHALFEPVHGSAPKHAGKGTVNPMAAILSAKMMLDWLSSTHSDPTASSAASAIENAVISTLNDGKKRTYDLGGHSSTSAVGIEISEKVSSSLREL